MSEMDGMIQFAVMVDFSLYRKALSQGRTFLSWSFGRC